MFYNCGSYLCTLKKPADVLLLRKMKQAIIVLNFIVFLLLSSFYYIQIDAVCSNSCNGHGTCEKYDVCKCFSNP